MNVLSALSNTSDFVGRNEGSYICFALRTFIPGRQLQLFGLDQG